MASGWLDYRTSRGRTLVYVSDACIVGAGVVVAIAARQQWSWGAFVAGPVVAVLGLAVYAALLLIVARIVKLDKDERREARRRLRARHVIVVPGYLSIGLCVGLISGSLGSYWPDVVLALMILVFGVVVPLAALPLLKRRADIRP